VSENLDLVRSIYAAWERGDYNSNEWADPEIEFVIADGPEPGHWFGLVEVAKGWRNFLSTWEDYRIEPAEYRSLDGERVLVVVRALGRGKSSGVELEESNRGRGGANLFRIRGGKVIRLDAYFDARRALADLGLAE
jgi:ketosteroid isomerase-like protein